MIRRCRLKYCINDCHDMSCHVMSCHVAIIVSTVIKIFSKLFYRLKISLNILRESLLALRGITTPHSVWLAMTKFFAMIKIFNSINIVDYSLMNYSPIIYKKNLLIWRFCL